MPPTTAKPKFEVLDANYDTAILFTRLATQWHWRTAWTVVPGGFMPVSIPREVRSGLDYPTVWGFIDRMPEGTDKDRVFWGVQVMEAAALEVFNKPSP